MVSCPALQSGMPGCRRQNANCDLRPFQSISNLASLPWLLTFDIKWNMSCSSLKQTHAPNEKIRFSFQYRPYATTRWLYCVECPQTVFGSKCSWSAICAQAVYFLHSKRPSVTWLCSRWWLTACDWVMSLSALNCRVPVLSTRVGRRRKFEEVSCTECKGQKNDFDLIPTVKWKLDPVEG